MNSQDSINQQPWYKQLSLAKKREFLFIAILVLFFDVHFGPSWSAFVDNNFHPVKYNEAPIVTDSRNSVDRWRIALHISDDNKTAKEQAMATLYCIPDAAIIGLIGFKIINIRRYRRERRKRLLA